MPGFVDLPEGVREFCGGMQICEVRGLQGGGQLVIVRRRKVIEIHFRQLTQEKSARWQSASCSWPQPTANSRPRPRADCPETRARFNKATAFPGSPRFRAIRARGDLVWATHIFKFLQAPINFLEPAYEFTLRGGNPPAFAESWSGNSPAPPGPQSPDSFFGHPRAARFPGG